MHSSLSLNAYVLKCSLAQSLASWLAIYSIYSISIKAENKPLELSVSFHASHMANSPRFASFRLARSLDPPSLLFGRRPSVSTFFLLSLLFGTLDAAAAAKTAAAFN